MNTKRERANGEERERTDRNMIELTVLTCRDRMLLNKLLVHTASVSLVATGLSELSSVNRCRWCRRDTREGHTHTHTRTHTPLYYTQ